MPSGHRLGNRLDLDAIGCRRTNLARLRLGGTFAFVFATAAGFVLTFTTFTVFTAVTGATACCPGSTTERPWPRTSEDDDTATARLGATPESLAHPDSPTSTTTPATNAEPRRAT